MNKTEFYKIYVKPYIKKNDKHFNRQLFHNVKDSLYRNKEITEKQCQNWTYPKNKNFE